MAHWRLWLARVLFPPSEPTASGNDFTILSGVLDCLSLCVGNDGRQV